MINFTREELIKLAHFSGLTLTEDEIVTLHDQLKKTLAYIEEIENFKITHAHDAVRNVNVFREDVAIQNDSRTILAQAPQTNETFFVVPKILEQE